MDILSLLYPDDTFWAGWPSEFPSGSQELFTSGATNCSLAYVLTTGLSPTHLPR